MRFDKPVTDVIRERFSCRSYDKHPINGEERQQLADFATANSTGPFGTTSRFQLAAATEQDRKALRGLGTYGFIKGATGFIIGAMGDGEKNLEDYGYLMEHIILYATDLGLGTCWLGGSFTKSRFAKIIGASKGESVPAVTSVGYIAETPRRMDAMIRQGAGAARRRPWEKLFFKGKFSTSLSPDDAGAYAEPLEMVRLGPSASNKQPWRIVKEGDAWHFFMQRTPGYREGRLSRLMRVADMQRIDMGIAMNHFELTAGELGLAGYWDRQEPKFERPDELTEYLVSWLG
jgi:nitroreductase